MGSDIPAKDGAPATAASARYRRPWIVRVFWLWQDRGAGYVMRRVLIKLRGTRDYPNWVRENVRLSRRDVAGIRRRLTVLPHQPLISVVLPVADASPENLRLTIESVAAQIYARWELCIAAGAASSPDVRDLLESYAQRDARIKVTFSDAADGVGDLRSAALALATGEFVAFLDDNGQLAQHAFYMVAEAVNAIPDLNLIYTDEDKIGPDGAPCDPDMKPDWNPDLLLSHDYVGHLLVSRRAALVEVGGLRPGFGGAQLYDLALRLVAGIAPETIRHIPFVLYQERLAADAGGMPDRAAQDKAEQNKAEQDAAKQDTAEHARRALRDHLAQRGIAATVEASRSGEGHRVRRILPQPAPRVSLIIPTRNHVDLLRGTITSILERTDYPDYEIVVVDNQSGDADALRYLDALAAQPRVRVLRYDAPFNYSAINNFAARQCASPVLGLLNNDIVVINADWLTEMVSHAVRPEVGAVGAMLYYPDETIQHAGIVIGFGGSAINGGGGLARGASGYRLRAELVQDCSAVTAACLLTRAEVFEGVGGLNETDLAVAFNDVDYCLKVRAQGLLVVWTPYAELYHLESASRGDDMAPDKIKRFRAEQRHLASRWEQVLSDDPYYNPNFSLFEGLFKLAERTRSVRPWRRQQKHRIRSGDYGAVDRSVKIE